MLDFKHKNMNPSFKINAFSDYSELNTVYKVMEIFFKILHLLLGVDYGFFKYRFKKYRLLILIGNFIYCCVLTLIPLVFLQSTDKKSFKYIGTIWALIQYLLSTCILLLFKRNTTFADFNIEIRKIDFELKKKSSAYKVELKLLLIILFFSTTRLSTGLYSCLSIDGHTCPEPFWTGILFALFIMSIDTLFIVCATTFYSIHCRLYQLFSILNDADIRSLLVLYKIIVDLAEKYKDAYNCVISLGFIIFLPQVMAVIYYTIYSFQFVIYRAKYFLICQNLTLMFAPAICTGMLTSTAEKIKNELHNKLLIENDRAKSKMLFRFIRYIEARPLKFYLWEILPLNANILGIVLNFCITYLIVVIQFTMN